ncbi:Formylglycine-generating enzyme, required for sulfatase activity, contains SUMF1/FGE domain [Pseudarthrobacter equi]|uniref:Formylglycine-generating enzyme, required for sulfatase activity, contains SUMF1/FGE domain n=1 Tax=Pseudarthrobacter equi TaxID=728066 RepID=A0A1H1YLF3_9MICC|nr:formylglycine-generating enzyme family protein [Pseudarthrobacter equi]SDT22287.1 Formylglycine-generating enzyme, required for sulfatase activity, contains SUMF1/FGE domain [Pseudarthrobacter equi]
MNSGDSAHVKHPTAKTCCTPSRTMTTVRSKTNLPVSSERQLRPHDEVRLPGGNFQMGDHFGEGYASDGEEPVHTVTLPSFTIDVTAVTNRQFAGFVNATAYRTEAEKYGTSAVFHLLVKAAGPDILGAATGSPWWLNVRGADWAHPAGPKSHWSEYPDHPVVQVSHNDARAYCDWAGRRLPSEAEWEYAARGGLEGKRYSWGNELVPATHHHCNIWQGTFPTQNTADDGYIGTAPVASYPANGYGLYDMAGNVWEWCADWFLPKYYRASPAENPQGPTIGAGRVMLPRCRTHFQHTRIVLRQPGLSDHRAGLNSHRQQGTPM